MRKARKALAAVTPAGATFWYAPDGAPTGPPQLPAGGTQIGACFDYLYVDVNVPPLDGTSMRIGSAPPS